MKTDRKLHNGMTWATCLYEYRFRMEQDQDVECPWGKHGWDGWLATIEQLRSPDFSYLESGEHNPEENETILYRRIYLGSAYAASTYLYVNLANLRQKYTELMGGTCNRKTLIAWANKTLDAEEKTVRQYLDGEVYGFIVERKPLNWREDTDYLYTQLTTDEDKEWEEVDSCWGFYGSDPMENGMSEYLDPMAYVKADFVELQKREHDKIANTASFLESARD